MVHVLFTKSAKFLPTLLMHSIMLNITLIEHTHIYIVHSRLYVITIYIRDSEEQLVDLEQKEGEDHRYVNIFSLLTAVLECLFMFILCYLGK